MPNLFKPTYLIELCKKYNLTPSKQYGQNFLISDRPVRAMIGAGELKKTDTVVEIGPGFGVLTLAMAPLVKNLIAFEIEKKIEGYWEEQIKENKNIEVVWGNALRELETYSSKFKTGYKVLANLPYQITSNILRELLELENKPEKIIVMVQKEVAQRICAKPGDMSLLAVSVQYYGQPKIITTVSRNCFWPAPKVDSSVLEITINPPLSTKLVDCGEAGKEQSRIFFEMVKFGFANKRKQLWRNLSVGLKLPADKVKQVLLSVVGNDKVRAQELGVEEWQRIAALLVNSQ